MTHYPCWPVSAESAALPRSSRKHAAGVGLLLSLLLMHLIDPARAAPPLQAIIGPDRIGPMRVDAPLPKLSRRTVVEDTWVIDESGKRDRRLIVRVGGVPVQIELDRGRIWRLTVWEPGLHTRDGIEVGTPAAAVAASTDFTAIVGSGADLIVQPVRPCGLVYRTNLELDADGLQRRWDRAAVAALHPAVTVRAIVVTACSRG